MINFLTSIAIKTTFYFLIILFSITSAHAQYDIKDTFGQLTECDTMTKGIFIVWWDKDFNLSDQVDILLDSMLSYRTRCLDIMNMKDPPNTEDGHYYNVYLHGNGYFSQNSWGNGQGTDSNGYPFLTLPNYLTSDWLNTAHETFHIFQYNATSPGFAYAGDSQWYIEASANWFSAKENEDAARRFVEAQSLVKVPHVPFWLSFDNFPDYYPPNWQRYVHQYALALFLFYLTDVENVPEDVVTAGIYEGTNENPQEYMYNRIGGENFRQYFLDWAAHMTNNFDFIPGFQSNTNQIEWNTYADPEDNNEFIAIYDNQGTNGWVSPEDENTTCAWSFNTFKLKNESQQKYSFQVKGEPFGSYGDEAIFRAKLVVQNPVTGARFYDLNAADNLNSELTIDLGPTDRNINLIIASMPNVFEDSNPTFQQFFYEVKIELNPVSSTTELSNTINRKEIARFNLLGQAIEKETPGIQIVFFQRWKQ